MDEHKAARDTARALQAEGLMNSDLLKEAFSTLEQSYIKAWRESGVADEAGREKLFLAINIVGKVKDHLQKVLNDGKLAAHHLKELAKQRAR